MRFHQIHLNSHHGLDIHGISLVIIEQMIGEHMTRLISLGDGSAKDTRTDSLNDGSSKHAASLPVRATNLPHFSHAFLTSIIYNNAAIDSAIITAVISTNAILLPKILAFAAVQSPAISSRKNKTSANSPKYFKTLGPPKRDSSDDPQTPSPDLLSLCPFTPLRACLLQHGRPSKAHENQMEPALSRHPQIGV